MGERLATMGNAVATLVLLRHGESAWNASNQFTGWVDVDLTEKGRGEAVRSGELIAEHNLLPDVLHTSLLRRAITTAHLRWIPPTGCGSRCGAAGGSTSATTARCRAWTRPRSRTATARSSSWP